MTLEPAPSARDAPRSPVNILLLPGRAERGRPVAPAVERGAASSEKRRRSLMAAVTGSFPDCENGTSRISASQ